MPVEGVVFDIGNVLIKWDPIAHYDQVIGEARRKAVFAAVDLDGMNERVDLGETLLSVVAEVAQANPDYADEIMIWHDDWLKMCAPEIPHSVRLLRALKAKGVPVFALTNFGWDTFDVACAAYPVLTEFDRAYVSGRMKVVKPEPEIYARLEANSGMAASDLLFTDDKPENITAAATRGWKTHLFEGPAGWAARLVAEGLLSEAEAQP
ncbi:HAD family phosphatase [Gymnodinialimonas sp. 2305UL16-5]|uniref:HAD family hydrolase n=1 Tax=Gymnodinialimonas mytili TaxID=3126503 RepID=UPI0030B559F8